MSVSGLRRFTVGGSDAASACGVDPHRSAIMLWAEKTGRVERPVTEAMQWGTLLEPVIVAELERRGYECLPAPADLLTDPARRWCVGHPDGYVVVDGERCLLEIKTTHGYAKHDAGMPPTAYAAQVMHYLHLTGLQRAVLAVLVGGQRLEAGLIERDDEAIALMLVLEQDFYEHLKRDKPPEPDGSKSARDTLIQLFPEAESSKLVRLDREHWRLVTELRARREQASAVDAQVTELENRLKLYMGDAELAISPHDTDALRWSNVQSRRVDTTALKAARPEIAEEFTNVTTTRRFTLL